MATGRKRTSIVKPRCRLDAPVLEKKFQVGSAMLGSEILAVDALADERGITRSEMLRELAVSSLRSLGLVDGVPAAAAARISK